MSDDRLTLPEKGVPPEDILKEMEELQKGDANWREGRTWSLVYYAGEEHTSFLKKAHNMFFSENGLSPMAFPSIKKFETEVIAMTAAMLGGDEETTGTMTSGGTESILMAVKTHRHWYREKRPDIKEPEMVLPETAHPAFEKASHYFDVKAVRVPTGDDFRAVPEEMRKAITKNTIMMVGSAPSYPHGVIDPIAEIAAIAAENDLGMHVDSCLGGFMLPFVKKLGYPIPDFDFRVPGVTSMSADVHKYGFAAKGASTVLYRNKDIRRHQFFAWADWSGGVYISPTSAGTRPAGSIAAAWATLKKMGEDGYVRNAEQIMNITKALKDGVNAIPGLSVVGEPDMSVFAFESADVNAYAIADEMDELGWHVDRLASPAALHIMVTLAHAPVVDQFLSDLRKAVENVRANPNAPTEGSAPMYGMMATAPDRDMIYNFVLDAMDNLF